MSAHFAGIISNHKARIPSWPCKMQSSWPRQYLRARLLACGDEFSISQVHSHLIVSGMLHSEPQFVASYARVGALRSARQLFDKMPHREIDSVNAIMAAYSRKNCPLQVLALYDQMRVEGVGPSSSSFTMSIKACASLLDLDKGEEIRQSAAGLGYEDDVFVASAVLNLYSKCGQMDEAMKVFDKMSQRDIVSWTTMITGFAHCEQGEGAAGAVDMYTRMRNEGIEGDRVVLLGIIKACETVGDPRLGFSTHGHLVRKVLMDTAVQTSLVNMYAKLGNMKQAFRVFHMMSHNSVMSWGALISGFAQNGSAGEALESLARMVRSRLEPDLVSLVSALSACSQVGYLKLGKSLHGYILRRLGYERVSGTGLIDLYAKCGSLSSACSIFELVKSPDLICWNTVIAAYGVHGRGKEALCKFIQLTKLGMQPNHATFAALLSALSHSGLVEEGQYWFQKMISQFHVTPMEKHYACNVDLLSRAGKLDEAHRLLMSAEIDLGLSVWVSLLSGCHNHGSFVIGEAAAKKILELNPDDLGIYALISNFFAAHKKWDEVAELRNIMRQKGMKKTPSYSLVEVNGKLCAFLMGDKTHQEINRILHHLEDQLK